MRGTTMERPSYNELYGPPPANPYDTEGWLAYLAGHPHRCATITALVEEAEPVVIEDLILWAVDHFDRACRLSRQAADHLGRADDGTPGWPVRQAYWKGTENATNPRPVVITHDPHDPF